jgi:hypothetical protein
MTSAVTIHVHVDRSRLFINYYYKKIYLLLQIFQLSNEAVKYKS